MALNKKKVIVIIQTILSDNEIAMIRKFGLEIAYIKKNISIDEMLKIDYPFEDNISTFESTNEKLKEIADKFTIERIFTLNEYYIDYVAKVTKDLNIKYFGLDENAAMCCRNKKECKKLFLEKNVPNAKYMTLSSEKEILSKINKVSFPLVVKPSNESGSKLVSICNNIQDMIDSVYAIREINKNYVGEKIDDEIIIEEFLDGEEYSVETYTIDCVSTIVAITSKMTDDCIEISHTVPARLKNEIFDEIKNVVFKALRALNITFGVTHTEVKITKNGVKVVEVNGRPGGDCIHMLVESVTGINLRQLALSIALDGSLESLNKIIPFAKSASIKYIIAPKDGVIKYNENLSVDNNVDLNLYYKNCEKVTKTCDNFTRLGYCIFYSNDEKYAKDEVSKVIQGLNVRVE